MRLSRSPKDHGVVNNSTKAPSNRYYAWLQASAEQAKKDRELPATILAACQYKGHWILAGCPKKPYAEKDFLVAARDQSDLYSDLYFDIIKRVETNAKARGISMKELGDARRRVDKMTLQEKLSFATMQNVFEAVMPNLVLVMSVHDS